MQGLVVESKSRDSWYPTKMLASAGPSYVLKLIWVKLIIIFFLITKEFIKIISKSKFSVVDKTSLQKSSLDNSQNGKE